MKQLSLIPMKKPEHGGELNLGKRKTLRPLATDRPIHLILKASAHFSHTDGAHILCESSRLAARFGVTILDQAASYNHVHILLKIPHRREYAKYMRALTGLLARKFGKGFFSQVPYTRVGSWGREYRILKHYLDRNRWEAAGSPL